MKYRFLTLGVLALLLCLNANAQIDFGLKAGISANWIPKTFVGEAYSVVPTPAFYGGVTGMFEMSDGVFIQGEIEYAGKGHSHNYIDVDYTKYQYRAQLHYLQVPAYVGYNIDDINTRVMIGPEFGYLFGASAAVYQGSTKVASGDLKPYCAPCNLALAVQVTCMFSDNFGVDIKGDFGLTRTFNEPYEYRGEIIDDKGHNLSVMLGLCYVFD